MASWTLEKLLSQLGLGSRKESRALVRMGLVEVDGEVAEDPFVDLSPLPGHLVVNGEEIPLRTRLFVLLHKPEGYECSHRPQHHESVFSLLPSRWLAMGIHCVGRLDVDTTGLLLLSNQGDFIHQVESPRKGLGKAYRAVLADPLTPESQQRLLAGVELRSEKGLFNALSLVMHDENTVTITVGEGVYHQVKRMFAAVGNKVCALHRVSIGALALNADLAPGSWRFLEADELRNLGYKDTELL